MVYRRNAKSSPPKKGWPHESRPTAPPGTFHAEDEDFISTAAKRDERAQLMRSVAYTVGVIVFLFVTMWFVVARSMEDDRQRNDCYTHGGEVTAVHRTGGWVCVGRDGVRP